MLQNLSGNGLSWRQLLVHNGESNHDGTKFADLDGDGDLDIYSIGWKHDRVIIHENQSASIVAPIWHDPARRYRIDLNQTTGTQVLNEHPVVTAVNFTAALSTAGGIGTVDHAAIRVAEVDGAGQLVDAQVPFQFDPSAQFNATSFATGEMVILLTANTQPGVTRHYQVYFDVNGAGGTPISVAPRITTTPAAIDEGVSTTRVDTPNGTWFYDMAGGGFTSLVDLSGNDWIDYNAAAGSAGQFRGLPNLVHPDDGGYFHPGALSAASSLTRSGPLRTTIVSTIPGTNWKTRWHIYANWATATVEAADGNFWFQYEGVPGGSLSSADVIHRSGGPSIGGLSSFSADLPALEWLAAADTTLNNALVMTHSTNDSVIDSYRDHEDTMTVMAFGRPSTAPTPLMTTPGQEFSVGFAGAANAAASAAAATMHSTPPASSVIRSISISGLSGPGGGWNGGTPPPTTAPGPTTEPPVFTIPIPVVSSQKFSFTNSSAPAGWAIANGKAYNGSWGWVAADGEDRQCGTRNALADEVLDSFCHATTRYIQSGGVWNQIASPASWKTTLANGTYSVKVTVGEATSHSSSIAHSVQAEGATIFNRVKTTSADPFKTNTISVDVTDGSLDLTFSGGSRTKIVSLEISPSFVVIGNTTMPATTAAPTTAAPTTAAPTTAAPTTAAPTTAAPTTAAPPVPQPNGDVLVQYSFGSGSTPAGWALADGKAFNGSHGWVAVDGLDRQCGRRNSNPDLVLDGFCHATTRYIQTNGQWDQIASPASWKTQLPNGTYNVTVVVGEASSHSSSIAHSVQAEGTTVHNRVATTKTNPFVENTVSVAVTDGMLDLTFVGGSRTKIVSVVVESTGDAPTTQPPATTVPVTTVPPTTVPATNPPVSTSPPIPTGEALRYSFTNKTAPSGWLVANGGAFDGLIGWTTDDGRTRQCGVRVTTLDDVLASFCHAVTRYINTFGTWSAVSSPAIWQVSVPNGTYEVTVTVGEAQSHPSSVRHSVQIEGVVLHDRVRTTNADKFVIATQIVTVTDGIIDMTFDGGERTKVVSIEIVPVTAG